MPNKKVWRNGQSFSLLEAAYLVCDNPDPQSLKFDDLPSDVRHVLRRLVYEVDHFMILPTGNNRVVKIKRPRATEDDINDFLERRIGRSELLAWCEKNGFRPVLITGKQSNQTDKLLFLLGATIETLSVQNPGDLRHNGSVKLGKEESGIIKEILDTIANRRDRSAPSLRGYADSTIQPILKDALEAFNKGVTK